MLKIKCKQLRLSSKGNLKRIICNGIPVLSIFALVGIITYSVVINEISLNHHQAYAETTSSNDTSASLIVDDNTIYDQIDASYSDTNYVSHKVTVAADNIDGYVLTITGPTNLTSPSGNNATSSDVVSWGYAWGAENAADSALTYSDFTGSTQNLETNTGITNNSVNLTKKLAFAAKFTNNAKDGHYTASVNLGLTVTPKQAVGGAEWNTGLESGITTMQEMTIDVCRQVPTPAYTIADVPTLQLKDTRDDTIYTIARWTDGNCWMTQNLRLVGPKTLTNADTDLNQGLTSYSLPASDLTSSSFRDNAAQNVYYANNTANGAYYTWCAATANSCQINGSAIGSNIDASSSICPRGWQLPTGNTTGQYQTLANSAGLTTANGSISIRSVPYNFVYAGRALQGQLNGVGSAGYYWTKTSSSATYGYRFDFSDTSFRPANNGDRYGGYSIRCVITASAAPTS